jgi:hypothetical protein
MLAARSRAALRAGTREGQQARVVGRKAGSSNQEFSKRKWDGFGIVVEAEIRRG